MKVLNWLHDNTWLILAYGFCIAAVVYGDMTYALVGLGSVAVHHILTALRAPQEAIATAHVYNA
jgi:hypothetical protein